MEAAGSMWHSVASKPPRSCLTIDTSWKTPRDSVLYQRTVADERLFFSPLERNAAVSWYYKDAAAFAWWVEWGFAPSAVTTDLPPFLRERICPHQVKMEIQDLFSTLGVPLITNNHPYIMQIRWVMFMNYKPLDFTGISCSIKRSRKSVVLLCWLMQAEESRSDHNLFQKETFSRMHSWL